MTLTNVNSLVRWAYSRDLWGSLANQLSALLHPSGIRPARGLGSRAGQQSLSPAGGTYTAQRRIEVSLSSP